MNLCHFNDIVRRIRSSIACIKFSARDRREAIGDTRLDQPPSAPPGLIHEDLQGIMRTTSGGTETTFQGICLEDRLVPRPIRRPEHDIPYTKNSDLPTVAQH